MSSLKLWFPMILLGVWTAIAGCEDDRAVADLGVGGDDTVGGTGEGGAPPITPAAGAAGTSGEGGAAGGAGFTCPSDIFAADGTACPASAEGAVCSDGGDNPCEFGQAIVCQDGKWWHQESFPAPCGGAGGGGAAGAAGAASGGVGGQ